MQIVNMWVDEDLTKPAIISHFQTGCGGVSIPPSTIDTIIIPQREGRFAIKQANPRAPMASTQRTRNSG